MKINPPLQSAGTALLSFRNNPEDELSSKAEQIILLRENPCQSVGNLFLFNLLSTSVKNNSNNERPLSLTLSGNGEEVNRGEVISEDMIQKLRLTAHNLPSVPIRFQSAGTALLLFMA